jgi:hypothetical protein
MRFFGSKKKRFRFANRLDKELYKEMHRQNVKVEETKEPFGDYIKLIEVAALAIFPIVLYGVVYVFADDAKQGRMTQGLTSSQRNVDDRNENQ